MIEYVDIINENGIIIGTKSREKGNFDSIWFY